MAVLSNGELGKKIGLMPEPILVQEELLICSVFLGTRLNIRMALNVFHYALLAEPECAQKKSESH